MRTQTNRTEFARYLDANPDALPELKHLSDYYFSKHRKKMNITPQFGQFLRSVHKYLFVEKYESFWLKRPDLWDGHYLNHDCQAHVLKVNRVA